MTDEEKEDSKIFVSLYITFCVLFIGWLISKFFRGRRQIHQAFYTIEEQLQRMQEHLDKNKDSAGEEEDIEDEETKKDIDSKVKAFYDTMKSSSASESDKIKEE